MWFFMLCYGCSGPVPDRAKKAMPTWATAGREEFKNIFVFIQENETTLDLCHEFLKPFVLDFSMKTKSTV